MFFDTGLNSADTMLKNIYEAFVEAATKMWAYVRCLPQQKQPAAGLVTRKSYSKPSTRHIPSPNHAVALDRSTLHDI